MDCYEYVAKHIYPLSGISSENQTLCDKSAKNLLISAIRVTFLQLFSLALTAFTALYKIFFTDDYELIVPVILPFVNPDTQQGFYFNLANQFIIFCGGIFIVPGKELVSCVVANNLTTMAHVINKALLEFNETLEKDQQFSKKHVPQLGNIVSQIMDFNRFDSIFQIFFAFSMNI